MTLRDIFGPGSYSDSDVDKLVYSRDASDLEGETLAVVWPKTSQQLHELVNYAKRQDYNLVIRGAGTNMQGNCIPVKSVVIDMSKMNKVLEIGDDYVVVQAGAVLDEVNALLGDKRIPVNVVNHKVCTIGGMVAMNCLSIDVSEGRIGDYIEKMEVVDGTGKYLKLGHPTVRNFIGLEGTTGIITKVHLKIVPKKKFRSFSIYKFITLNSMMEKVEKFRARKEVKSIQFFDEISSGMLGLDPQNHMIVEFDGDIGVMRTPEEINSIVEMKEVLYHKLKKDRYCQFEDVKVSRDKIAGFLHWLRKKEVPVFGNLCHEVVFPCFKEFSKLPQEMHELVMTLKGESAVEFGYGLKRKKFLQGDKKIKYKILRDQYNPKDILNRGKVHE